MREKDKKILTNERQGQENIDKKETKTGKS